MENPEDVVPQLLKAWAQSDPTLQRLKAKLPERWADLFGEGPGDKPEPAAAGARRP